MVSEQEIMRTIKKTKTSEQWTTGAKSAFKKNIESLMVYLASQSVNIKQDRWDKSNKRVISIDVDAAFGRIWPNLYHMREGDNDE